VVVAIERWRTDDHAPADRAQERESQRHTTDDAALGDAEPEQDRQRDIEPDDDQQDVDPVEHHRRAGFPLRHRVVRAFRGHRPIVQTCDPGQIEKAVRRIAGACS
jgi:hypothetical protein